MRGLGAGTEEGCPGKENSDETGGAETSGGPGGRPPSTDRVRG